MDSSNHWYGHAHALAAWCGRDALNPPPIDGVVQHGWTFVHGFGAAHKPPAGRPKLVWADISRRRGEAIGWQNYIVIGAPFAYLAALTPEPETERHGTIWYPFHGTQDFEQVEGDHDRLVAQIREAEGDDVTVCLYYVEYENPRVRQYYEDAGFRVICHGHRGTLWQGTEPEFLHKQLAELRRHKKVASNRLSTAVMYGALVGCEIAVYGDPMEFQGVKDGFDGQPLFQAWWPFMFGVETDTAAARALAEKELGADILLDPEELDYVLGWTDGQHRQA